MPLLTSHHTHRAWRARSSGRRASCRASRASKSQVRLHRRQGSPLAVSRVASPSSTFATRTRGESSPHLALCVCAMLTRMLYRLNFSFKCHRKDAATPNREPQQLFCVNDISFHPIHGTFSTAGSDGSINFWDKDSKTRLKSECRRCACARERERGGRVLIRASSPVQLLRVGAPPSRLQRLTETAPSFPMQSAMTGTRATRLPIRPEATTTR